MKDSSKLLFFIAFLIVSVIFLSIQKKRKEEEAQESNWWLFSKTPQTSQTSSMAGCTNCWVSSIEDGVSYCRWYDQYGRNTSTYEGRGCTGTQANIGFGKRKKKWWESLFNI